MHGAECTEREVKAPETGFLGMEYELTPEVPEQLAREAISETSDWEEAQRYVLDHAGIRLDWSSVGVNPHHQVRAVQTGEQQLTE
jgi:hypothetical protein